MRALSKLLVLLFSILHRIFMVIWGAHAVVLRNLFSRHPDADRPRSVHRS